ncbi:MAG: CBS domain-containing protein, partial [Thermostichus sp. BF3_bins_97]
MRVPLLRSALLRRWLSVAPDCPAREASRRIVQRAPGLPAILWIEQDKQLLGSLSALDLLRALQEGIPAQTPVRELGWTDPVCLSAPKGSESLETQELSCLLDAARQLAQQQLEALPILDTKGYPKGILTPLSLLQALKPLKLFQLNAVGSWVQPLPLQAPADLPLGSLLPLLVQHRAESVLLRDPQRNTPMGWILAEQILPLAHANPDWPTFPAQAVSLPCGVPLHASESLAVAYERMLQEPSANLLVVNSRAQVLGRLCPRHLLQLLLPEQLFLSHRSAEVTEDLPREFLRRPGDNATAQNSDPEVA